MRHVIRNVLIAFSFTACSAAYAATTVPFTFVAGNGAKASEVNANFQALAAAIDAQVAINTAQAAEIAALTSRVTLLDTPSAVTAADLVGTYSFNGYRTELGVDNVMAISAKGTIQLFANGTATMSNSIASSKLLIQFSATPTILSGSVGTDSGTFTWSLTNGQVSLFGNLFAIASGGRLLVNAGSEVGLSRTNGIVVLVRVN